MPRDKGTSTREFGRRYREVVVDCAKLARQYPKGERLRVYRECLKARLRAIEGL
jgi:hypothetical protein